MRTLVPAETLVYLETDDLAAALQPIVDNKAFLEVAKSKPDFSALKGVQLAVAVTGFETSEEKLTDEHSVGRVQPHFVAVADTHSWNYQAVGFAEKKLGAFVTEIYDSEPALEKSDKNGGKYFTWKAKDGRKAYALVIDSLIYFGNDETAIDKCLAVRRGETDSIAIAGKVVPSVPGTLASGYVGPDGIAQISNIIGLKFASEAGEDSEVQSAIAGILPQLLRNSVREISWSTSSEAGDQGLKNRFMDRWLINTNSDVSSVFSETMLPSDTANPGIEFLPINTPSATFYNLKNPQTAWRSVLLVAQKQTDEFAGKIIGQFAGMLFEPYGIRDAERFLSGVDSNILTANFDADGSKPVVIATIKDSDNVKKGLSPEIKPDPRLTAETGVEMWRSDDGDLAAAFVGKHVVAGDAGSVLACVKANQTGIDHKPDIFMKLLGESTRSVSSAGSIIDGAGTIAELLGERKSEDAKVTTSYFTETRFTKTGIDRRTTSDFGLIGSIIVQLAQD